MFKTEDAGLVAALQMHDWPIEAFRVSNRRVVFEYEETEALLAFVERYESNALQVPAKLFNEFAREVNLRIRNCLGSGYGR